LQHGDSAMIQLNRSLLSMRGRRPAADVGYWPIAAALTVSLRGSFWG
jgi:hypothetical protein